VRPRRQGPALLCGPSTSPLDAMLRAICLIIALWSLASQAIADVPECQPKRAVLSIRPLDLGSLPRTPPTGYVEVAFTIAPTGLATDTVVVSSHVDWSEAPARAIKALSTVQFDPPTHPCKQTMKVRFDAN
jgi:hypothetical protein